MKMIEFRNWLKRLNYLFLGINDIFKNLTHLKVVQMKKFKTNNVLFIADHVCDVLKDEDVVEFELTSSDIWIKVSMQLDSLDTSRTASFEVRVRREMRIVDFKRYMCKNAITMWNQMIMHDLEDTFTFHLIEYCNVTKTATKDFDKNHRANYDSNEFKKSSDSSFLEDMELDDDCLVEDYFGFRNLIKVEAKF